MRRVFSLFVAVAFVVVLGPARIALAGEPESYRYRSVNAYLDGRARTDAGRVSLDVYGYESAVNGETTSRAGASIFIRHRRSGLSLHCWTGRSVEAAFDVTRRSASLGATAGARCHTHDEESRRGRGLFVLSASWIGGDTTSSYSSTYSDGEYRCFERSTYRSAVADASVHFEAEAWDVSVDLAFTEAEGQIGWSRGGCRVR